MVFNWGKKMVARQDDEEDMTMEEILASIRRYVADDKPAASERPKVSEFKPSQESDPVTNTIIVEPNPEKAERQRRGEQEPEEEVFELTELVEEEVAMAAQKAQRESTQEPPAPTIAQAMPAPMPHATPPSSQDARPSQPQPTPQPVVAKEREMQNNQSDESMASSQTMQASLSALSKLAEVKRPSGEQTAGAAGLTLDRLVADLARPMIKEWLDKHLASMVERMVAKEIERITKDLQR